MSPSRVRIARDYNRGLPPPIRAAHIVWAALDPILAAPLRWSADPARRWWARPLLWALLAFLILYPFDGPLMSLAQSLPIGGDINQELKAWQQYGALGSILFTALLIRLLDPARTRRLLDLAAAALATFLLCQLLKIAIGRPRPDFNDPHIILTPFGAYPLGKEIGVRHAWELWSGISTDLWSIPSSHTAAAAALSVFLITLYPRLRPLCITLVCIVGLSRVLFKDHWPTDVAAGAATGVIAARAALRYQWGERLIAAPLRALRASGGLPLPLPAGGSKSRRDDETTDSPRSAASQVRGTTPESLPTTAPSPPTPDPLHSAP